MGNATATRKTKLTKSDADELAVLAALREAARGAQRIATANRLKVVSGPASVVVRARKSTPNSPASFRLLNSKEE